MWFGYFPHNKAEVQNFIRPPKQFSEHTGSYDSFWIKTKHKGMASFEIISKTNGLKGNLINDSFGLTYKKAPRSEWLSNELMIFMRNGSKEVEIKIEIGAKSCSEMIELIPGD
jgi:hypothetical protein